MPARPNGGGKSTLLETVLGLLPPQSGTIRVGARIPSVGRRASYVPQSGAGQFAYTFAEMVLMGRTAHHSAFAPPGGARSRRRRPLAAPGIETLVERDWLKISSGERQLALIARAIPSRFPPAPTRSRRCTKAGSSAKARLTRS